MKQLIFLLAWFRVFLAFAAPPTTGQFLFQQKPASGPFDQFGVTPVTNQAFGWDGSKVVMLSPSGGISWGGITGTLSSQTDLQSALNAKQSLTGTLALAGFGSITGTLPNSNLSGTVQLTTGTLALGTFGSITGTLADARLSANVQLKNGTLALAGFGSISGTLPTANLPATIPDGNISANVQLKDGTLALNGFGSVTGTLAAARIADLSATYLTVSAAASGYQPLDGDLTAISALSGTNTIYYRSAANTWTAVTIGSGLGFSGGSLSATNSGTVTSVALTVPSILSVTGSPITSSGALAISLADQSAHAILAGPTSGSAATPTFRALVATDIPDVSATYLTAATAATTYQPLDADLTALAALGGTNNIYYRSAANTWTTVAIGSGVSFSGGILSATGTGTVTSVGLTAPSIFAVGNSPIITSGDIAITLATQTANRVWAGPTTGSAATPTFRALVAGDIPDLSAVYLSASDAATTYQPLDADLTALAGLTGTNNIYYRSAANTWTSVTVGTNLSFSGGTLSGSGSVSSVALSLPAIFSVTGSPITSSGTLAVTLATQSANLVFAGPNTGSAAAPTFRVLVAADVPDISATYLTTAAATAGYQPLDGDLTALAALSGTNNIYYRSAANTWTSITVGTGLTFSAGTLSANTAGTVTSVALSLPAMFNVTGSPITSTGTLTAALANQVTKAVLIGPVSGSAAAPTFRILAATDIPDLSATYASLGQLASVQDTLQAQIDGKQPLDADLTALAALSGTNNIYYRSAANTWTSVTIGGNLSFSGGTLTGAGTIANTFTGAQVMSVAGTASTPAVKLSGTWFTGGTSTTTKPHLLVEGSGAASTNWSTDGTGIGVNAAVGFTGYLLDLQVNSTPIFQVGYDGNLQVSGSLNVPAGITVTGDSIIAGALTVTNGLVGTTAADNAPSGNVGQVVSSFITIASPVALTTATTANITSISLTAGDWDVSGLVSYSPSAATVTQKIGGINTTSATVPNDGSAVYSGAQLTTSSVLDSVTVPVKRVNVSSTTTVYLVGNATFSAGSVAGFGYIYARRVR